MVRNNPGAFVIVTGCYAQLESENVSKIEGVDLVLGANEKAHLIQYLSDAWAQKFAQENGLAAQTPQNVDTESSQNGDAAALHQHYSVKTKEIKTFQPSCSRGNRTRYFLKVQDGCNYYCTYCTIPLPVAIRATRASSRLWLNVSRRLLKAVRKSSLPV